MPDAPDVEFACSGIPRPEGSTAYKGMRGGRPIILHDDPHLEDWRRDVGRQASRAMKGRRPFSGPIRFHLQFVVPRPMSLPRGRLGPTVKPDLDKLVRAIGDALNGIAYDDDAQVTSLEALKRYPLDREIPGVIVRLWATGPQQETLDGRLASG